MKWQKKSRNAKCLPKTSNSVELEVRTEKRAREKSQALFSWLRRADFKTHKGRPAIFAIRLLQIQTQTSENP